MGNFMETSLREVWTSPNAIEFREKINRGEVPNDECERCLKSGTNENLERATFFSFKLHENAVEELLFAANCPKGLNQSNWNGFARNST